MRPPARGLTHDASFFDRLGRRAARVVETVAGRRHAGAKLVVGQGARVAARTSGARLLFGACPPGRGRRSRSRTREGDAPRPSAKVHAVPTRASKTRAAVYSKRESNAPRRAKQNLERLRADIASNNYKFQVGYTEAMERPLAALAGLSLPAKPLANAPKQNSRARAALGGRNLMVRTASTATSKPRAVAKTHKRALPPGLGAPVRASGSDSGGAPASLGSDPNFADLCSPSANAYSWASALTPIRNQGACGSCWAFAAVGTLEASNAIINGAQADLAEQHALSCSGGGTCIGGWYTPIYDWLSGGKDGLQTESKVPYTGGADSAGGTPKQDSKDAEELFAEAYDAFAAGKYADAKAGFAAFKSQNPDDPKVPYALYFMGVADHELGEYWDSLLYFAEFADAYWDHDWIPYVYYWAASAYVGLGECGYATQLFEVVIYGDLGAPQPWIDASRDTIDWLAKDKGQTCTSW